MRAWRLGPIFVIPWVPACVAAGRSPDLGTFTISPGVVQMGAFYNGVQVKVEGIAENGSNVIVIVAGKDCDERFNTKAKAGPIWLNSGKVRVTGVPSLLLRFTSGPVELLLAREVIEAHDLDEGALRRRIRIEPAAGGRDESLRGDFVALKSEQGRYQFVDGGVAMGEPGPQGAPYSLAFTWPRRAPPATYDVRVYEIRDGSVIRESSAPLRVTRVGFPAWLAGIAQQSAPLYGLTAVVVGAIAGFGIDFATMLLFGKKRSIGH